MKRKKTRQTPREEEARGQLIERPDGFYWRSRDDGKEYGPFATLGEAEASMEAVGDAEFEPGESLEEAESEIGIAEWIDPDTGAPAEESVPRIDDK
jgi:hypothetical protein